MLYLCQNIACLFENPEQLNQCREFEGGTIGLNNQWQMGIVWTCIYVAAEITHLTLITHVDWSF